jgi:predicted transcriptional regulator
MKGLSLKQPYAELIVAGKKTIELRKWNTRYRGRFLVHASMGTNEKACRRLGIDSKKIAHGAVIGEAQIYSVKLYSTKMEFMSDAKRHMATYAGYHDSKYGFMLKDARRFPRPIKLKGALNFFEIENLTETGTES